MSSDKTHVNKDAPDTWQTQRDSVILRELEKEREARREERDRDRDIRSNERARADSLHKDLDILRDSYRTSKTDLEIAQGRIDRLELQLEKERQQAAVQETDSAIMNTTRFLQVRSNLPTILIYAADRKRKASGESVRKNAA
jgi:hypothetical protein